MSHQFIAKNSADLAYIKLVGNYIIVQYDESGIDWQYDDNETMWRIKRAPSAGVVGVNMKERICCAKLFYDQRIHSKIRNRLGLTKAKKAYERGCKLNDFGVPSPQIYGYVKVSKTGLGILICELLQDYQRVDAYIQKNGLNQSFSRDLARFIFDVQQKGVEHKDLSPRNIMVDTQSPQNFKLLDFEDIEFKNLNIEQRIKNIEHFETRLHRFVPKESIENFSKIFRQLS
ncbi:MAG: lipopolysaccharide kinase InaA family protein [Lentisphaeria bacterium]|nr:lipopolysaccharide kinase InaA family protein [Lentisphaeria bacterium]